MNRFAPGFLGIVMFVVPSAAGAAPIQWNTGAGANFHWYELSTSATVWTTAQANATGSIFDPGTGPLQGYLATITSAEENTFVDNLTGSTIVWIGGTDQTTEGTWVWAGGPEAGQIFWVGLSGGSAPPGSYENWAAGEPNNLNNEDYLEFRANGTWNDLPNSAFNWRYVVEYNQAPTAVPEPATLSLVGLSLAGAAVRRRYRRQ